VLSCRAVSYAARCTATSPNSKLTSASGIDEILRSAAYRQRINDSIQPQYYSLRRGRQSDSCARPLASWRPGTPVRVGEAEFSTTSSALARPRAGTRGDRRSDPASGGAPAIAAASAGISVLMKVVSVERSRSGDADFSWSCGNRAGPILVGAGVPRAKPAS
jgi:hypothetical protein